MLCSRASYESVFTISGDDSEGGPPTDVEVIAKSGVIFLVPDRPILSLRGFVKGIPTDGFREKKDRM